LQPWYRSWAERPTADFPGFLQFAAPDATLGRERGGGPVVEAGAISSPGRGLLEERNGSSAWLATHRVGATSIRGTVVTLQERSSLPPHAYPSAEESGGDRDRIARGSAPARRHRCVLDHRRTTTMRCLWAGPGACSALGARSKTPFRRPSSGHGATSPKFGLTGEYRLGAWLQSDPLHTSAPTKRASKIRDASPARIPSGEARYQGDVADQSQ